MEQNLQDKIKTLPTKPGVYQFKNKNDRVIYVGKAKNLRNRVRSYFQKNLSQPKTVSMIRNTSDLELVITDSEIEALVLENNLIKELKPRYNVNLRDDKSFPFIKVTNEPYPRVFPTRRVVRDGSKYFGPYTDVKSMRSSLRMINQIFKIRSCKYDINDKSIAEKKYKICLDYHIKKCDGPCEGLVSEEEYNDMVSEVVKLLKGKTDDLIKELNEKMERSVANLEFEKAAELRDKLSQLKVISSKQKVVSDDFEDRDIIAIAHESKDASCSVFTVRNGKFIGKKQLRLSIEENEELSEIYSAAIKFYYTDQVEVPQEIVTEVEPGDAELLKEWLQKKTDKKIKFVHPQRGNLAKLLKMCKENASLQLKEIQLQKIKKLGNVPYPVSALQRDLRLEKLPLKIECFDISNIQGSDAVASMVVFEKGKPKKSLYRKFIIKTVTGPDDFGSMREVIRRRYTKLKDDKEPFPDLIIVDGGKGQLSSAVNELKELGFSEFKIIGLAKRLEEVFFPGNSEPESIPKTSSGLKLLQQIRDEAHRFAITFHRQRRSRRIINTELTEIKGIGSKTAQKLLKEIGSLEKIKSASIDDLMEAVGKQKAELIRDHLKQK